MRPLCSRLPEHTHVRSKRTSSPASPPETTTSSPTTERMPVTSASPSMRSPSARISTARSRGPSSLRASVTPAAREPVASRASTAAMRSLVRSNLATTTESARSRTSAPAMTPALEQPISDELGYASRSSWNTFGCATISGAPNASTSVLAASRCGSAGTDHDRVARSYVKLSRCMSAGWNSRRQPQQGRRCRQLRGDRAHAPAGRRREAAVVPV